MTKKLIIAAMSLSLVSSVFAHDDAQERAMENDGGRANKEDVAENNSPQEGPTTSESNHEEATN